jgi:NADH-quinone oxidoreductase subunit G
VLRVLGNMLGLSGFEYEKSETVRDEACPPQSIASRLDNRVNGVDARPEAAAGANGLQRIADVPIYFADALARRSPALQQTRDALPPKAWMTSALFAKLGLKPGERVRVKQGAGEAVVETALDDALPADCVRLAAAHHLTSPLGAMYGAITVERA